MKRAYYDKEPLKIEAVGNGNYLYRWDIQEETTTSHGDSEDESETITQYSCEETTIHGEPTYDKCVEAVIRHNLSVEQEFALVNKYNSYNQGVIQDANVVREYEDYLSTLKGIKNMVKKDFSMEIEEHVDNSMPKLNEMVKLISFTVNNMELTDTQALEVKSIYPDWSSLIGKTVQKDYKLQYDGKLWKVLQEHLVQEQFKPGVGTESLYTEIVENHEGTIDDPIPYNNNMELELGKYYSQNGVTYYCHYGSGIPVYANLKDLAIFVTPVEQ